MIDRLSYWHAVRYDDQDLAVVRQYRWWAARNRENGNIYAMTQVKKPDGRRQTIYMHRLITECRPGLVVDHANGDTLDNRRANLRVTTSRMNGMNHDSHGDCLVPYRGVSFCGKRTYRARIVVDGKDTHLGTFTTAEAAARAYDKKARELYGEFAWSNFPVYAAADPPPGVDDIPF